MPQVNWTDAEKKDFWRSARAALLTTIIVVAILLLSKIVTPPPWLGIWIFLIYFVALFVVVYKAVRARWGK